MLGKVIAALNKVWLRSEEKGEVCGSLRVLRMAGSYWHVRVRLRAGREDKNRNIYTPKMA